MSELVDIYIRKERDQVENGEIEGTCSTGGELQVQLKL